MGYWKFIRQDWPLLAFGFLLTALSGPGQTFFVGLFRDPISAHFGISIGDFGLIFSTATLVSAAVFFWSGKLIDRWSVRYTTTIFACLFALAAAMVGLAPHVAVLALAIFGIRHLGQALMSHVSSTTMARAFNHNRAKAASLATLGYSVSESIFPISIVFLLATVGWRVSWLVISLMIIVVFLPLALLLLKVNRRDLGLEIAIPDSGVAVAASDGALETPTLERHWTRKEVLRDPRFYLLFPVLMGSPYILTGFFFHQASLAGERGLGLEMVAAFFTGFAVMKMIGSLILGPVVDKYGPLRVYPGPVFVVSLALFSLGIFENTFSVGVFYLLSGFGVGAGIPVSGALWPALYGTRHLGAVRSMLSSVMVLATGLAPASYGYMLDGGITISQIALGAALYSTLAMVPLLYLVVKETRRV